MGDIHDDLREVMGLLPCPFCGAPVDQDECPYPSGRRTSVDGRTMYVVNCTNNECGGQCLGWGADGARKAWNTRPALLAAAKYEEANPLGGPATMLEAAARRIRAGEDFHEVLADYGLLARQEGEDARDAERYRWLREWYLRGGKRSELDPLGHIRYTTPAIMDASIDAARSGGGG